MQDRSTTATGNEQWMLSVIAEVGGIFLIVGIVIAVGELFMAVMS